MKVQGKYSNTFTRICGHDYQYKYSNGLLSSRIGLLDPDSIFERHCGSTLSFMILFVFIIMSGISIDEQQDNNNNNNIKHSITVITLNNHIWWSYLFSFVFLFV